MRRFLEDSEMKHMIYSDLSAVDEYQHLFRSLLNKCPGGTASDTLFPSTSDCVCEYTEFDTTPTIYELLIKTKCFISSTILLLLI